MDVNAPKVGLEAKGPKVDVGAKVGGFLEGVGADIGGLFSGGAKAPKAELNVQAPAVDVNVPKPHVGVGLDVQAPHGDMQLTGPKLCTNTRSIITPFYFTDYTIYIAAILT